ncbi:hypothetical protein K4L06_17520 [Lysobacter sp. BMK333-48F3]|uniref:hypothetical protein n=1 Tax=Lysobacter sp. BMK333-48F3 TaxID=2867962 RepID=UPI001C8CAE5F|nr:hypothetical protein [Lysobacter sp. BMK333-48F3]MBX9403111.1 hypothetical protein [Lysobacter sp. BMK333-48F3]
MRVSMLSRAALAAFVFACSAATAFSAENPCQTCYATYDRCQRLGLENCEARLDLCLRRNNCPLQ